MIDNITLSLVSLKQYIEEYLDGEGWKDRYNIFLGGDPILRERKIVIEISDRRTQVSLPIIIIDTGLVRSEPNELGTEQNLDYVTLSIIILAIDDMQIRTLGNALRRKLQDLTFDINDYSSSKKPAKVSSGLIQNVVLTDISNWNSDNIAERYNVILNGTMELNSNSFI